VRRIYHYDMTTGTKTPAAEAKNPKNSVASTIARTMRVSDILTLLPNSASLIAQYGLSCFSCSANDKETLEEGCRTHGMPEAEIDDLVTDLNEMLKDRPDRPQTLSITQAAAEALKNMMEAEDKAGWGLKVGLDDGGGFCMEFSKEATADDRTFANEAVPAVKLFASALTLAGIGGATIDLRDGRFKLDLPEDSKKKQCACKGGDCTCGGGGNCGCTH
jgi:hybrid cluster-associated redox disulfide protein